VLPPLQGPDEITHVAYVQRIVESREIPWQPGGNTANPGSPYSTELASAANQAGLYVLSGNLAARPADTPADEALWNRVKEGYGREQRADGGFTSAMKNPPLYYLYSAIVYAATEPLDLFDQLFVMRLANIPILMVLIVFAWLLAGELLGGRRALQTLATAVVALQPQLLHLAAVVNPDVLLAALWTAGLYVCVVTVKRGITPARGALLVALCGLSGLTHGRGLALILPAALTIALRLWRDKQPGRPRRAVAVTAILIGVLGFALVFAWVATRGNMNASGLWQLASYLWQFYLPRLGFLHPMIGPDYGFREIITERYYGAFAQLEVGFSSTVYDVLWWVTLLVGALAITALVVHRRSLMEQWDVALVLGGAVLGLLALLHAVAYRALVGEPLDPIIAGRYLLPVASLYGVGVALAVSLVPGRWGAAAAGAVVAALALLQLSALGITVERFYA
jgi:4-amino-4-deoxy-L-arabinose transferase-like glycosyltransferase